MPTYQRGWYQQNGQWYWYPGYPGEQPDFSIFPPNQQTSAKPQYPWMQQPAVPAPAPALQGRPVQTPDEIKPSEVPLDKTICFFPLQDMSMIYAKQWGSDGTLATVVYQRVDAKPAAPAIGLDVINSKLDSLLSNLGIPVKGGDTNGPEASSDQ